LGSKNGCSDIAVADTPPIVSVYLLFLAVEKPRARLFADEALTEMGWGLKDWGCGSSYLNRGLSSR